MLDRVRAHPIVVTAVGVQERVRDIEGAPLASAVTLTFFLTLFPVLLVAIAVLGFVAVDNADLAADLIDDLGLTGDVADMLSDSIDAARDSRSARRANHPGARAIRVKCEIAKNSLYQNSDLRYKSPIPPT